MANIRYILSVGILLVAFVLLVSLAGCGGFSGSGPGHSDGSGVADGGGRSSSSLFATADSCERCHGNVPTESGEPASFTGDWDESMMSEAAEDPYFHAKLAAEIESFAAQESAIESKCLSCHMPMGHRQALENGEHLDFQRVQAGDSPHQSLAMDGVSCTVCHQIQPDGLGTESRFNGSFAIDTETRKPDRAVFGPFDPVSAPTMQRATGFQPMESDHVSEASLCGSCHTLFTPTLNESGAVVGSFPEQTPYLEWRESDYTDSTPCQSCHMPSADGVQLSRVPPDLPQRTVREHQFVGPNAQMATLLGNERGADRAEAILSRYVTLDIERVERTGDTVHITVAVRNRAGHKFPTGYPARRAWIHLQVTDAAGETVFESGSVSDSGKIAGRGVPYEPHHRTIRSEESVQIYQSVMADTNGEVTRTLLEAAGYRKDNRIPPAGFVVDDAPDVVGVRGNASADPTFGDGRDTVTYVVDATDDSITVHASLLYQPVSYPFLESERGSSDPTVSRFLEEYDEVDKTTVVDEETRTIGS